MITESSCIESILFDRLVVNEEIFWIDSMVGRGGDVVREVRFWIRGEGVLIISRVWNRFGKKVLTMGWC